MTRPVRKSGCFACGIRGHLVTTCTAVAAVAYWFESAGRHRATADEHAARARAAEQAGALDDARYHRRAAALETHDADRAERRARKVQRMTVAKERQGQAVGA